MHCAPCPVLFPVARQRGFLLFSYQAEGSLELSQIQGFVRHFKIENKRSWQIYCKQLTTYDLAEESPLWDRKIK